MARSFAAALLAASLLLVGCIHHEHHRREVAVRPHHHGSGPPPHAPAHGYRHKHRGGVDLVYDTGLGVYVVIGWDQTYFHDGHYVRHHGGDWQRAAGLNGPWSSVSARALPPGLRHEHRAKASHPSKSGKHSGKGQGAAKPAW